MDGLFWILAVIIAGGLFLAVGVGLARLELWLEEVTGWRMFPDSQEFEDEEPEFTVVDKRRADHDRRKAK